MANVRICLVVLVIAAVLFAASGCNESEDIEYKYEVGAECEVVLRAEFLEGLDRFVTPTHTSSSINGSKDSVRGKLIKITDDWIIVSLADIKVKLTERGQTTYGKAGEKQRYEYWVPRSNMLYMKVWKD